MVRIRDWGGLAVGAFLVTSIMGCSQGGGMSMTDEPESEPTLVGTWQTRHKWTSAEGQERHSVNWLTFAGHRAVYAWTVYDDGAYRRAYSSASEWEATDTTVTRLWYGDYTEDEIDNPVHGSTENAYHWGNEARSIVYIEYWSDFTAGSRRFERWERVPANRIPSIVGKWLYDDPRRDRRLELEVETDRVEIVEVLESDNRRRIWRGAVVSLDETNYVMELTGIEYEEQDSSGAVTRAAAPWSDGDGQMAYAPFELGLAVSPIWQERDEDYPYGDYWMYLEAVEG